MLRFKESLLISVKEIFSDYKIRLIVLILIKKINIISENEEIYDSFSDSYC